MAENPGRIRKFLKIFLNKYVFALTIFVVFVTFFDDHSLLQRWKSHQRISQMEDELEYYQEEIKQTRQKIHELHSNNENLEKFAREHYYMKKKNEDIFIIKE